jgi:hypothetical protein
LTTDHGPEPTAHAADAFAAAVLNAIKDACPNADFLVSRL